MLWFADQLAALVGEDSLDNWAEAAYSMVNGIWPGGLEFDAAVSEVHRIEWGQRCIEARKLPVGSVTSLTDANGSALSGVTVRQGIVWFPRVAGGMAQTDTSNLSGSLDAEYTLTYKAGYSTASPLETGATAPPDSLKMAVALLAQWLKNKPTGVSQESVFGNSVSYQEWPTNVKQLMNAALAEARR